MCIKVPRTRISQWKSIKQSRCLWHIECLNIWCAIHMKYKSISQKNKISEYLSGAKYKISKYIGGNPSGAKYIHYGSILWQTLGKKYIWNIKISQGPSIWYTIHIWSIKISWTPQITKYHLVQNTWYIKLFLGPFVRCKI